jgi:predicted nucleic acid-binding protein
MNGNKYLADTNAFIYFLGKHPAIKPLIEAEWYYSFISRVELLGKHGILSKEVSVIEAMLSSCISLSHTDAINNVAISLRQRYKIKTPDTLIAATAIHNNLPLLTADTGFTRIKELNIVLIEL